MFWQNEKQESGEAFGSVPTDSLYYLCTIRVRISTNNTMWYPQLGIPKLRIDNSGGSVNFSAPFDIAGLRWYQR